MAGLDPAILFSGGPSIKDSREQSRISPGANDERKEAATAIIAGANQQGSVAGGAIASMLEEELRRPLRRRSSLDRLWASKPSPLTAAAWGLTLTVAGAVFWLARQHDPGLGEPLFTSGSNRSISGRPHRRACRGTLPRVPWTKTAPPGEVVIEGRSNHDRCAAGQAHAAPARGFIEKGPDGPLPKIARDGRRPFDVYARPVHRAVLDSGQPKIAILLGGMGLNGELTGGPAGTFRAK